MPVDKVCGCQTWFSANLQQLLQPMLSDIPAPWEPSEVGTLSGMYTLRTRLAGQPE